MRHHNNEPVYIPDSLRKLRTEMRRTFVLLLLLIGAQAMWIVYLMGK